MTAQQHLRTSDLDATLKRLMQEVRDNPAEPKHRIFLFQLLQSSDNGTELSHS